MKPTPTVVKVAQKSPGQDTPRASRQETVSEEALLSEIRAVAAKVKNNPNISQEAQKRFGGFLYQLQQECEDSTPQQRAKIRRDLHEFKQNELP
ncbi:MAG: hypothetical protein EOO71_37150 [Myxococcaceae bacterium]|nr:MAG: hypothetical protein EOO71_37150 [Myxococcaceae bacterium]